MERGSRTPSGTGATEAILCRGTSRSTVPACRPRCTRVKEQRPRTFVVHDATRPAAAAREGGNLTVLADVGLLHLTAPGSCRLAAGLDELLEPFEVTGRTTPDEPEGIAGGLHGTLRLHVELQRHP